MNENSGIVTADLSSKQDALNSGSDISINSLLVGSIISSVNSGDMARGAARSVVGGKRDGSRCGPSHAVAELL